MNRGGRTRERAKGGWGRTPEHACPLVAVCRQSGEGAGNAAADFQALLHEQSRGFCLLHHLFLLEGAFHLCIHLNSKEALKKKNISRGGAVYSFTNAVAGIYISN